MSLILEIHSNNPQLRHIKYAVDIIRKGGVIVYPTDTSYAIACHLGDKAALDKIRQIKSLSQDHHFTLVCRDLSEISIYAHIDNPAYRLLKKYTPGPFTFLLEATKEVPKRLLHPKRKTIGLRIPDSKIVQALLDELNEPIMTTTLQLPGDEYP